MKYVIKKSPCSRTAWTNCHPRLKLPCNIQPLIIVVKKYSNKTWKLLKLAGVPQTTGPISAASGLKFTILWGHLEDILLLKFFSDCWYVPYLQRYSPTKLCDGAQMAIFGDFFASCISREPLAGVQHVLDLHLKFALRPHHVWKYGRHPICNGWDQARKKKKKEETTGQKYNGLPYSIGRP